MVLVSGVLDYVDGVLGQLVPLVWSLVVYLLRLYESSLFPKQLGCVVLVPCPR
jgi:hypothetical protein